VPEILLKLLRGERSDTTNAAAATRWVAVYLELSRYKARSMAESRTALEDCSSEVRAELELHYFAPLQVDHDRYVRRFGFWTERCRVLAGVKRGA